MNGLSRRGLFGGLLALAAPAVIRTPGLLMAIKPLRETGWFLTGFFDIRPQYVATSPGSLFLVSDFLTEQFIWRDNLYGTAGL